MDAVRHRTVADPIISIEHLTMRFGGLIAVNDLSLYAQRGEITALIGPNGAGKTTVFNCVTGFYKPSEGMITLTRPIVPGGWLVWPASAEFEAEGLMRLPAARHPVTATRSADAAERSRDRRLDCPALPLRPP